ncbi:MAG: glycoside hydrolase family protein [Flavobacteriaceae bacterium]
MNEKIIRILANISLVLLIGFPIHGLSQEITDDLNIKNMIQPLTVEGTFRDSNYYNWGGSIIKGEDGKYHLFYSRWKRETTFYGWLTLSEIAHATSNNPTGPWVYKETALKGRGKGHWDEITAHNPKIKYFEGKYYLYYISTNIGNKPISEENLIETSKVGYSHPNWKILRTNQRTGVAVSNSINGPWQRMDQPLLEPSGPITTLTVNPAIDRGKDGKYYLIVKGDKPNDKNFTRNQAIATSNSPTGPFIIQEKPVIDYMDTEDMSVWYDDELERFYGVFHAHTYIGLMISNDGLNWTRAQNYNITNKKILLENSSLLIPDRMERPFVYVENSNPTVLCLAIKKGNDSYTIFIPLIKKD